MLQLIAFAKVHAITTGATIRLGIKIHLSIVLGSAGPSHGQSLTLLGPGRLVPPGVLLGCQSRFYPKVNVVGSGGSTMLTVQISDCMSDLPSTTGVKLPGTLTA